MTRVMRRPRRVTARILMDSLEPRTYFSATPADLVAQANNAFAFDLFHDLSRDHKQNLFFSPYSAATALEIVLQGASGTTAEEMIKALHLPAKDLAQAGIQALYQLFHADPSVSGYMLSTANKLWIGDNFKVLASFLSSADALFGASTETVDFSDPESAAAAVNAWANEQTHGKIPQVIGPKDIGPYTAMILANAIYFKGDWKTAFKVEATRTAPFYQTESSAFDVQMMHQTNRFRYYEQTGPNGYKAIDLPYQGDNIDMIVILPTSTDIDGFQSTLDADFFSSMTSSLSMNEVIVDLPKFTLDVNYSLTESLQRLGMGLAFTDYADFSGISDDAIKLDYVKQRAFIQVDEKGTEAAAVTVIGGSFITSVAQPQAPKVFNADHPFLFALRDRTTNAILFMGRVSDPGHTGSAYAPGPRTDLPPPSNFLPGNFILQPFPIKISPPTPPGGLFPVTRPAFPGRPAVPGSVTAFDRLLPLTGLPTGFNPTPARPAVVTVSPVTTSHSVPATSSLPSTTVCTQPRPSPSFVAIQSSGLVFSSLVTNGNDPDMSPADSLKDVTITLVQLT